MLNLNYLLKLEVVFKSIYPHVAVPFDSQFEALVDLVVIVSPLLHTLFNGFIMEKPLKLCLPRFRQGGRDPVGSS